MTLIRQTVLIVAISAAIFVWFVFVAAPPVSMWQR
jgi:hypothetical protein